MINLQHSYFYWKVEKQSYICDISFWPQIYHITNMSQLCMWIAFLRWDLNMTDSDGVHQNIFHISCSRSMLIKNAESIIAVAKFDGRKEVRLGRYLDLSAVVCLWSR